KAQGRTGCPEDEACCPQRLARRLPRVVTVRALFGPSRNSRVVLRAVLIALASAGAVSAVSVVELLEQGDRLTQSDEGFPDAFLRAVALYEEAAALDPQNPVPHIQRSEERRVGTCDICGRGTS